MKNDKLHHSEPLAKFFAPRRGEPAMLSAPEIEKLLDAHDMLPNHPPAPSYSASLHKRGSIFTIRRTIMTLSTIAAVAAISYFTLFHSATAPVIDHSTARSYSTETKPIIPTNAPTPAKAITEKPAHSKAQPKDTRGPWSAGNDQIYADLTPEELARLGLVIFGDTVRCYNINLKQKQEEWTLTAHSSGGPQAPPPSNMPIPKFFPVLATMVNGHSAAYRIEDSSMTEWGMIGDNEMQNQFRSWLLGTGTPGYHLMGYNTSSYTTNGTEYDTLKILIVKDLPQPLLWPLRDPFLAGVSDSNIKRLVQLSHYYEGTAEKPDFKCPLNLTIKVDTTTPQKLADQMDEESNSNTVKHVRSVMARLNELIPIIVRPHGGSGSPDSSDFIFWYQPSEDLFNALPPMQAAAFRQKLAAPPHCMTAPNAVLTQAEITFCLDRAQTVHITVRDLTGKARISWDKAAIPGDNIDSFRTATLASGMYLVTVKDEDGNERTRRIWVENAHPKDPGLEFENMPATNSSFMFDEDSIIDDGTKSILHIPALELSNEQLAQIGIETNDSSAGFYFHSSLGHVDNISLLRHWNPTLQVFKANFIQIGGTKTQFLKGDTVPTFNVQSFEPKFITNGKGRKRLFLSPTKILAPNANPSTVKNTFQEVDKQFQEVAQLVPILLRNEESSNDSVGFSDLIFWYEPTPQFFAALPDSARAIAEQMAGTANNQSSADDLVKMRGAIQSASVFPNPSKGNFTVQLTVNQMRTLTFTLRNLLGQEVAPPLKARLSGNGTQALDFSAVAEGVYLLDISSDEGERYIQRVLIAK